MRRHRPVFVEAAVVAAAYAAGSLLLLGPVLAAPADRVYGLPSDPLGEVWRLEKFDRGEIGLFGNRTSAQANAPSGVELRRPADAAQILYDVPAALSARLLGPILAYNLLVFFAFFSAALATYGAMRLLGTGALGSFAAGALFALAPVHVIEAQLHVGLAQVFMLPALLLLGSLVLRHSTVARGALLGALFAVCAYVTAYLLLEALALAVGLAAAAGVVFARHPGQRRPLAGAAGAALGVFVIVISPLLVVLALSGGDIEGGVHRSLADVSAFSLDAADYVSRAEGSYVGIGILVLGLAGLALGNGARYLRLMLGLCAAAGFLVSLDPTLALGGLDVPMPSRLIHAVVPYWRVFGRAEMVVALCLACLAGLAIDRLTTYRRPVGAVLALILFSIAIADVVRRPPDPAGDLGHSNALAAGLSRGTGTVAEYPLWGFDNYRIGTYLFRQLSHGRPLFNGSVEGTLAGDLSLAAGSLSDPSTLDALTLAGVREVVVGPEAEPPRDSAFRLEARFPDGTRLYEVSWSRRPAVASFRSAYDPEPGPGGASFRWLGAGSKLSVASRSRRATVTFMALSPGVRRVVSIGGVDRDVTTAPTRLTLCVPLPPSGHAVLPVRTAPPPQRLAPTDPRVSGLGLYDLAARSGCRTPS